MQAVHINERDGGDKEMRSIKCTEPRKLLTSPAMVHFGPYAAFMAIGYMAYAYAGGDIIHGDAKTWLGYASTIAEGLGLASLRYKVRHRQSISGISGSSIKIFALTYTMRLYQLWPRSTRHYADSWAVEILSFASLLMVLDIMWCLCRTYRKTYQQDVDVLKVRHLVPGCVVLACALHPQFRKGTFFSVCWAFGFYLDVLALLPQVVMMAHGSGRVEAPIANYVAAISLSRCVDLQWWFARGIDLGPQGHLYGFNYSGWLIVGMHLASFVLAADFVYYYLKARVSGSALEDIVLPAAALAQPKPSKKDIVIGAAAATGRFTRASLAPAVPYAVFLFAVYLGYVALGGSLAAIPGKTMVGYASCIAEGLGLVFLRSKISRRGSARGISGTSIKMFAITYTIRLWQLWPRSRKYLLDAYATEVLSAASLLMVLEIAKCVFKDYRESYQRELEVLKMRHLLPGCFVMACLLHPSFRRGATFSIAWTFGFYLDVTSLLPQVAMMARAGGRVEAPISNYVAAITVSRTIDIVWWLTRGTDLGPQGWIWGFNYSGFLIIGIHVLSLFLAGDFLYFYLKAKFKGHKFDDDLVLPYEDADAEAAEAAGKEATYAKVCTV